LILGKKKDKKAIKKLKAQGVIIPDKTKKECCKKYKKNKEHRCEKCPCFDLIKKVA